MIHLKCLYHNFYTNSFSMKEFSCNVFYHNSLIWDPARMWLTYDTLNLNSSNFLDWEVWTCSYRIYLLPILYLFSKKKKNKNWLAISLFSFNCLYLAQPLTAFNKSLFQKRCMDSTWGCSNPRSYNGHRYKLVAF